MLQHESIFLTKEKEPPHGKYIKKPGIRISADTGFLQIAATTTG
jgi:hypothetical protein